MQKEVPQPTENPFAHIPSSVWQTLYRKSENSMQEGPYPDKAVGDFIKLRKKELHGVSLRIAVDGEGGSGKGNLTSELSKILEIPVFDSGKYYRAITAVTPDSFFKTVKNDASALQTYLDSLTIKIQKDDAQKQHVFIIKNIETPQEERIDVTDIVDTEPISKRVSDIAKIPVVRMKVKAEQNNFMEQNSSFIIEGRNMYAVAKGKANIMIYLHAEEDEIIRREMVRQNSSFEEARKSAVERTHHDAHRTGEGRLLSRLEAYGQDSPYDFCIDTSFIKKEHTPLVALNEIAKIAKSFPHTETEKNILHLPVLATT